jgi:NADH dehydrogenase
MSAPRIVAVFGGTGFLGHNIAAHLRTKGLAVRVVARHPGRAERVFGEPRPELSYPTGDLLNERSTAAAIEGAYMVVNAVSLYAERDGITFEAVHVEGATRVATLCTSWRPAFCADFGDWRGYALAIALYPNARRRRTCRTQ